MPRTNSSNETGFKKFLKQNKSLALLLPLLAVLLIVVVIVNTSLGGKKAPPGDAPSPSPSQGALNSQNTDQPTVEILPNTERVNDSSAVSNPEGEAVEPLQDPFKSPMKLTGTLIYSDGVAAAIIEYGGVSYIVQKDESVGDSPWMIVDVTDRCVSLESEGKSVTLEFDMEHSYPSDTQVESDGAVTVTIKAEGADMRDIISAIALEMRCSVLFTGESSRIDIDIRGVTQEDALSTLLKSSGLDYFRNGDTLIVGTKENLKDDFFSDMAITKFSLRYITSDMVSSQISALGLNVQRMTLEENPHAIWVQGFPQELGIVGELVYMLDKPENAPSSTSTVSLSMLTPIQLSYITAEQMNAVLSGIGLEPGLMLDSNPKTLYVYANKEELGLINELKNKLDIAANQQGSDSVVSMKKLQYVKVGEIVPIIGQFGMDVDIITLDRIAMTLWLLGDEETVRQVSSLIDTIDIQQNLDDSRFFIRKMSNISALEAEARLNLLEIPEISTYTFNYPAFAKSILVVCPEDYHLLIKNHLNMMDVASDVIKIPVDYSDESSGSLLLAARRDLLVSLTGIPATSFSISNNVSRTDVPHYVLILEATQEKIRLVQDLINQIDNPLQ